MLYYFAGFNGYLLLGHYLRNHDWTDRQLRGIGIPMFAIGYAVTFIGFRHMISLPDFTEEIQGLLFPPDSPHIVSAVRECENKRDNQQHFAFSLEDAIYIMLQNKVGVLPVVDNDQISGIITDKDVFHAFFGNLRIWSRRNPYWT